MLYFKDLSIDTLGFIITISGIIKLPQFDFKYFSLYVIREMLFEEGIFFLGIQGNLFALVSSMLVKEIPN